MYLVKDERPQSVIILSRDYEDSEYRAAVILQNRLAKRAKKMK